MFLRRAIWVLAQNYHPLLTHTATICEPQSPWHPWNKSIKGYIPCLQDGEPDEKKPRQTGSMIATGHHDDIVTADEEHRNDRDRTSSDQTMVLLSIPPGE